MQKVLHKIYNCSLKTWCVLFDEISVQLNNERTFFDSSITKIMKVNVCHFELVHYVYSISCVIFNVSANLTSDIIGICRLNYLGLNRLHQIIIFLSDM